MNRFPPDPTAGEASSWAAYHRTTRTATYGFLSALPLLLLYEVMIFQANLGRVGEVRVGAEVWLKEVLFIGGRASLLLLGGVVLLIGFGVFFYERHKHIPLRPKYFLGLVVESAAYAVLLGGLVSGVVGALLAVAAPQGGDLWTQLALSIGAGIYEELFFRVLLVGGLYLAVRHVVERRVHAYLVAAVVGALLFSTVHYLGALGSVFTLYSFTFRFLFGLALNVVFLTRGFGVAAWTHALYDVFLVLRLLG